MFSLKEFEKIEKRGNIVTSIAFIVIFFVSVLISLLIFSIFNKEVNNFIFFIIFFVFTYIFSEKVNKKFTKKHKDVVSYIFLREYTGKGKYDLNKNFTSSEIENFIENLNCKEYAKYNSIPIEYYYTNNKDYLILKFDEEKLLHYTREISWKKINWKYAFVKNDGIYEDLEIEYKNENGEVINEKIITDKVTQENFHIFLLFILYDLKYGKRLSLSRINYKKRFPFKILGLSNNI